MKIVLAAIFALLIGASSSEAFNYTYQNDGSILHWAVAVPNQNVPTNSFDRTTHAIRFYISSNAWSTTNTFNEINAVRNSFGQWQSVPNSAVRFEDAGLVTPTFNVNTSDNTNIVFWATNTSLLVNGNLNSIAGALAVTFKTWFTGAGTTNDGVISQFDIAINGTQNTWFTDFNDTDDPNSFFVEGTLCHEIGHSLGLNHANIGGATMLYSGQPGVDTQAGLSVDEVAFARALYPASNILSSLGNLKGIVTKSGSPVLGASVVVEDTNGNLAGGTVSLSDGSYLLNALPIGTYNVRVVPLSSTSSPSPLITGPDVATNFNSADPNFLPTGNIQATLTAGATNTLNFTVTNGTTPFHIGYIRQPTSNPGSFSIISLPETITVGQSNMTFGVFSEDLPTNNATLSLTGTGVTIGATSFQPTNVFSGLNGMAASISVASNAPPGLRTLIVTQGTNIAYANGFLEILPAIPDYNFDGLADRFQRKYFFPFTSSNAAPTADPDGDGYNNYAEYISGTNPTNAQSFLKIASITRAANGATITFASGTNCHYQLLSRTNINNGSWQNVGSVFTATATNSQILDSSGTNGTRFYRLQALP